MHLFSLNDDILSLIIAGLSPFDASQVMMTSRSGYDIAIPRFLSEVAFTRRTPISAKRVRQFCDFMLADPRRRIPCLRALTLDGPALADSNFEYPCPCHLSKVLAFATGLTELHLGNVDTLLDSPTCFPKALASLSSLESIRLEVGPCTCQLLHHLKSRPRTVDLYRPLRRSRDGATHVMLDGYTITCFLPQTLAPVLTRLRLRDCIYIAEELHRAHRTFPTVHTLTLDGRSGELVSIAAAFPNLRHLQLRDVWLDPTQPNALWRRLDHVEISTPDDLFLPVVKPIRRLDVREPIESWQQLGFLKSMLETTRPTVLICPIMYDRVEAWLREPNAHSALLNLKYLHLVLRSVDEDIVVSIFATSVMQRTGELIIFHAADLRKSARRLRPRWPLVCLLRIFSCRRISA